jgi:type VI secretion system secreted protein VgrG
MEQEGIFYYFRHERGKHTLVLADQKGAYRDCGEEEVDYPRDHGPRPVTDHISSWEHGYAFTPGKWSQTDDNFQDHPARSERTPSSLLMTEEQTTVKLPNIDKYEVYDYPGAYPEQGRGKAYTKIRMEEEEVDHDLVQAGSTCRTFTPGGKFKVRNHRSDSEKGKTFVITWINHRVVQPYTYESGGSPGQEYGNTFSCIPDSVTFRPRRVTPKPSIRGSQTAVVTGPDGQEIWPDKFGRVRVQFPWDREGKRDDTTSCWIRCVQSSAGKGWGSMFIPRIGQEVVVSYLEGDPDRPLITGVVYNADQMPPYTLPDEKTKSYIKSCSSKDADGYNELRFEDKKDGEQIFIHAQKDMDTRVKAVSKERIGGDRHKIIGSEKDKTGDEKELVFRDRHLKSHRNREEHVGGDMKLTVGGVDGPGNQDIVIKGDKKELLEKDSHVHVKGSRNEKVDAGQSLTVGGSQQEKVGMKHALDAGMEIHLKAGMNVVIEAGLQLTLKGPGGFISIDPVGVAIQGNLVMINSGGAAGAGSGASPTEPQDAAEAAPVKPAEADNSESGQVSSPF